MSATILYHATSFQRCVPASSIFCAGEWMAIARQSSGEEAIAEDEARRGREAALEGLLGFWVAGFLGSNPATQQPSNPSGGQTCPL
jgi:hypothetical protein